MPSNSSGLTDPTSYFYRHKKRGTRYRIIALSRLQLEGSHDMAEMVTYQDTDNGSVWNRLKSEFFDGRFEEMPADKSRVVETSSQTISRLETMIEEMREALTDIAEDNTSACTEEESYEMFREMARKTLDSISREP